MDTTKWNISKEEHARWLSLCKALVAVGVVTEEDLKRPLSDQSTPGARLFTAVRRWGDALTALMMA